MAIYINFFAHIEVKPFHITKMNSFYNIKKYNSILGAIKEYKKIINDKKIDANAYNIDKVVI